MYTYSLLYTSKLPLIKHEILILPSGRATHNHPNKNVTIEHLEEAVDGQKIVDQKYVQSVLSENEILGRAYLLARSRKYSFRYNCEDYIVELFGRKSFSKQRNLWFACGLLGLALMVSR